MCRPSGDQRGDLSGPVFSSNFRWLPEARSTTHMSLRALSSAREVGTTVYAICFPSGDHCGSLTSQSRDTTSAAFRVVTSITTSRVCLKFWSTTTASFFSLAFASSSALGGCTVIKAIRDPSGDQLKSLTPLLASVSTSASPPKGDITYTCGGASPRAERKAIRCPSGDHSG